MWRTHTYFASQFFFFLFRVLPSFLLACPLWVVLGVIILRFRFILFDSFFLFFSRCSYCVAGVYTLWLSYPVRHGIALSNLLTSTLVLHNDALPLLCVVVRDHRAWTSLGWRLGTGAGHGVSWMSMSRRRTHACHLVYMRTCVPRTALHMNIRQITWTCTGTWGTLHSHFSRKHEGQYLYRPSKTAANSISAAEK